MSVWGGTGDEEDSQDPDSDDDLSEGSDEEQDDNERLPAAITRLHDQNASTRLGDDIDGQVEGGRSFVPIEGVRVVKDLTLEYFRGRLVEHFDILFQKKQIVWPKRNKERRPSYPP